MNNFKNPNEADHVVVSISGGKDSSVLMKYAVDNFPKEKIVCVHAEIDIDWDETMPVVREQCEYFGLPLVVVKAVDKNGADKGFLSQLLSPRVDRKTGEIKEYMVPDMANRWCTSMLKTGPIDKYCRSLKGKVLCLIGERREESPNRAKLEAWRPDIKNSSDKKGRYIVKYSPILDLLETEVWDIINKNEIPTHPCYSWGVSRASCAICIFSSNKEIAIAAERAPHIVKDYIKAEAKISTTFRYKRATKTKPERKISLVDILESENFDLSKLNLGLEETVA